MNSRLKQCLIASVALNGVLLAVLSIQRTQPPSQPRQPSITKAAELMTNVVPEADKPPMEASGNQKSPEAQPPVPGWSWHGIETADLQQYIENLRRHSCPEDTIRDIIVSKVKRKYAQQLHQLTSQPAAERIYWKNTESSDEESAARSDYELTSLQEQETAELNALLGNDWGRPYLDYAPPVDPEGGTLAFLPQLKQKAVKDLQVRYHRTELELSQSATPTSLAEQTAELAQQQQEELQQLLTPQELEDYRVRFSPLADSMRGMLGAFELSEAEFRAIFRLQEKFLADGNTAILQTELSKLLGEIRYQQLVQTDLRLAGYEPPPEPPDEN